MELLKDKIAVITGGTRGIGLAAARVFLQNGAKTAILGSRKETVEQAMNQLRQEMPDCPVQGYWPDLTCREQVRQTMAQGSGAEWIFWSTTPVSASGLRSMITSLENLKKSWR